MCSNYKLTSAKWKDPMYVTWYLSTSIFSLIRLRNQTLESKLKILVGWGSAVSSYTWRRSWARVSEPGMEERIRQSFGKSNWRASEKDLKNPSNGKYQLRGVQWVLRQLAYPKEWKPGRYDSTAAAIASPTTKPASESRASSSNLIRRLKKRVVSENQQGQSIITYPRNRTSDSELHFGKQTFMNSFNEKRASWKG